MATLTFCLTDKKLDEMKTKTDKNVFADLHCCIYTDESILVFGNIDEKMQIGTIKIITGDYRLLLNELMRYIIEMKFLLIDILLEYDEQLISIFEEYQFEIIYYIRDFRTNNIINVKMELINNNDLIYLD